MDQKIDCWVEQSLAPEVMEMLKKQTHALVYKCAQETRPARFVSLAAKAIETLLLGARATSGQQQRMCSLCSWHP